MDVLQRYWNQFRTMWSGLGTIHRVVLLSIAAVVLGTTGILAFFSMAGDYEQLVTGLPPEEAAAMVAHLESANIPYRLENGGSTILVPKDRHAKARVELASQGPINRGGKGWEIFDNPPLTMTPFVQNVNYTRAMQAELARSIMNLESVSSARVIIARAEPSPFVREQQPTTASVVLKLKPGAVISQNLASGIVSLVARSVEGLRPENVTVVDSAGRLIIDKRARDGDAFSSEQLEFRRELETYLSNKAEELLARHLGAGRALVRVSTDLNQQKVKELRESFAADERVAKSETTSSFDSGSSEARGVAGAGSNTGRGGNSPSSGGGNRSREERSATDYLVPKTTRLMETQPGMIQRLTVAVMVDLTPSKDAEGKETSLISVKEVEELVKTAVGFQSGRDDIKVSNVQLTAIPTVSDADGPNWIDRIQTYVHLARNISLMVAFVFLAATFLMLARRWKPSPPANADEGSLNGSLSRNGTSMLNGEPNHLNRQQLMELANTDPRQVARLLSTMMRTNGTA